MRCGGYRDAITEGVLMWNLAFEGGFKDAIQVHLITPLGTRLMCVIIQFAGLIRWMDCSHRHVNPNREILDADIM